MKHEEEIKKLLIDNAIQLIAEGGFEKATTKNLAYYGTAPFGIKMNEAYLYRIFGSKETLYQEVFFTLEKELYAVILDGVEDGFEGDTVELLRMCFEKIWHFVLGNEARCRCYLRYYYSVYFSGESLELHQRYSEYISVKFSPLFKEEADVKSILHSVFTSLLDFAIRVYNGILKDDETTRLHVFNVLYCMMITYFKEPTKAS